jgi:acyl-CoA-binding protein
LAVARWVPELTCRLPKGGPVQTSYEDKLALYSLYKQGECRFTPTGPSQILTASATEGDIAIPRPGMLDLLGRAKWLVLPVLEKLLLTTIRDSWNKRKGVGQIEAKRLYMDSLLRVSLGLKWAHT